VAKKKITKEVSFQLPAGKATPQPPVATTLGPTGINTSEFCTRYNDATKDKMGDIVPVKVTIYEDRSFDIEIKTPPAPFLIKKYANIKSGSGKGKNEVVGTLKKEDLKTIAEIKLPDLNAYDVEEAMKIVAGTAKNMGVTIED
jgi:large subunit ribosomal protein L11